jgi:DinB superfamily
MFSVESFVYAWDNQLAYALALVKDLTDAQMVLRPGGNMNHPAWMLGHLSGYHPITVDLLAGKAFEDPKFDPLFGFAGHGPLDDIAKYGSKDKVVGRFKEGHEQVAQALLAAKPEDFNRPPSLARWAASYPTVGFMLPDLLLHHESLHIGQISIWRRAAGLPGVPFPDRTPRAGLVPARKS